MNAFYEFLYTSVSKLLATSPNVPDIEGTLKTLYENVRACYLGQEVDLEKLLREALSNHNVLIGDFLVLEDSKDHEEWLYKEKADITWAFWSRYKEYLLQEHMPPSVIDGIDDSTDAILGRLESPSRQGNWDRRGMVVGSVQSGKTSNYIGLICKAVDAGYKVIIVLAGVNNDLRSQTQKRIDLGFLGLDTSKKEHQNQTSTKIGVGLISSPKIRVTSLTNSQTNGDYRKDVHRNITITPGGDPVILVIKKNTTPLKNVFDLFSKLNPSNKLVDVPLLLIDDEADNASIDTKALNWLSNKKDQEEQDPTKINGYIRNILDTFTQSAYVGYTATPFANIFIYPNNSDDRKAKYGEDLFPRSFIISLDAPSNYLGPERLFGLDRDNAAGVEKERQPLPLVRCMSDYSEIFPAGHKKDLPVTELPDSLKEAIFAFILSNAVRNVRKIGNKHQSMLVHVTRFTDVQKQIAAIVKSFIRNLRTQFEIRTGPLYEENHARLQKLWTDDFVKTYKVVADESLKDELTPVTWEQIEEVLYRTIAKIDVKEVNGAAKNGGLNYDDYSDGYSVIAIGGDKLSRGLTLEGLSVSYYTRPTKMYDTLLQMGRWFGYRRGFLDVCRLYTSKQHIKAYRHIAVADFELRKEFDNMAMLNATPENYGLKIRTDPEGQLRITAYNKMRNSTDVAVAFAGKTIQITRYCRTNPINERNVDWLKKWLPTLTPNTETASEEDGPVVFKNVSAESVCNFIQNTGIHKTCIDVGAVVSYIQQQTQLGELTNWTVALISTKSGESIDINGRKIGLSWRTDATPDLEYVSIINNQLIKEMDERIDLTPEQQQEAKRLTLEHFTPTKNRPNPPKNASPYWVKRVRKLTDGLLLIYLIQSGTSESDTEKKPYKQVYVGYAISFPESFNAKPIYYKADAVYQGTINEEFGVDEL
jgi:hypothetical protein